MRLEDLNEVLALKRRRDQIKGYITDAMTRRDMLDVVIAGSYMNDAMIALIKPVVTRELSAWIADIDRQLEQLGVDTQ